MSKRTFGVAVASLALLASCIAWAGAQVVDITGLGPGEPVREVVDTNPGAGFEMGNPPVFNARAADGPVDFYVAPKFENWERMPAKTYRFVASAWSLDDRWTAVGPAESDVGTQPAGVSTDPDQPRVEVLSLDLPRGSWKVYVSMHDLDMAECCGTSAANPYLPALHAQDRNGPALQTLTCEVNVR
jgi:hypothetical protein